MRAILDLSSWRILHENTTQQTKIFFHYRMPEAKYVTPQFSEAVKLVFEKIEKIYPAAELDSLSKGASKINFEISIPLGKETEAPLILDFGKSLFSLRTDMIKMPDVLMSGMQQFATDSNYSKKGVFWIEAKPEYSSLTADGLKQKIIESLQEKYILFSDGPTLREEFDALFYLVSTGVYEKEQFCNDLLKAIYAEIAIDQIRQTQLHRTVFDSEQIKSDFSSKKKEFMVDYSDFSQAELEKASSAILTYLNYLSNLLDERGPDMNKLIEEDLVELLRHFKRWPKLWQLLGTASVKYF